MTTTAKRGQWIAKVLGVIGYRQYIAGNTTTVQTLGDNQRAIHLVKSLIQSERSKHIDICYHSVRDLAKKEKNCCRINSHGRYELKRDYQAIFQSQLRKIRSRVRLS